jgi:YHS domain-containing protein
MAKVKDPVCGMVIESERAVARGTYAGQVVYFCSAGCKVQYETTHPPG